MPESVKVAKLPKDTNIPFRHYGFILKPKIKQIADDKNLGCFVLNGFKKPE